MTHIAKIKKWKWLISIFSLLGASAIAAPLIVSCSSTEPPKQEVPPPKPNDPSIPSFDSSDKELEWLWNDVVASPIQNYINLNQNEEICFQIINESKPFNSLFYITKSSLEKGEAKNEFLKLMKESSIIGINYFQITNEKELILIPGYENSPLYGPWGDPIDSNWPSTLQAQLRWTRTI